MIRRRTLTRSLCILLLAAVALTALWAAHARLLEAAADWLDVGGRPQPADYVMILNGGENSRPFAAAALMKTKLAHHALITECAPTPAVDDNLIPPYHEVDRQVLINRGVPAADITILPAQAKTTFDEAQALAAFLADKPDARVLLVTNDYHTRRSRWVFAHVLGDRIGQLSFVSAPTDDCPPDCWWRTLSGVMFVPTEYLKFVFYVAYYGHFAAWLATCGMLLAVVWLARRSLRQRQEVGQVHHN
jgi:uncharacterized SAM-binding protein YcdF (DUF218 family)